MKTLLHTTVLLFLSALAICAQSVLFVGNSFTFMPKDFARGSVTDLHGNDVGGIPAIFRKLAEEGGHDPKVSHELSGGKTLEWHYKNHANKADQSWDVVILQEYSTRPLTTPTGGSGTNREAFRKGIQDIKALVDAKNPSVKIYLYETWARPNLVEKGVFGKLSEMQDELREAYSQAAADFELAGWIPVGDGFLEAVNRGVSDDPATEVKEGPICVWGSDHYHQSDTGAYLSALMMYSAIYQADPRELPVGEGSAAAKLSIQPEVAKQLQAIAYDKSL